MRTFAKTRATVDGPSIWTGTGYIDLADPCPADIALGDIARGLANLCRFTGLCDRFYSVAEHSVHCAVLARRDGCSLVVQRAVLMHDAAEAYLGDVSRPLKRLLPDYRALEGRMAAAIARRFDLVETPSTRPLIKQYDDEMLAHEKEAICPGAGDWPSVPVPLRTRAPADIGWHPSTARAAFLEVAKRLGVR